MNTGSFPMIEYTHRKDEAANGLPADEAVFLGAWEGKWGRLPTAVVITKITTGGKVSGYYGWGKGRNFEAGSAKITGKIGLGKRENKVLRFKGLFQMRQHDRFDG
jgi:hypothetical protein